MPAVAGFGTRLAAFGRRAALIGTAAAALLAGRRPRAAPPAAPTHRELIGMAERAVDDLLGHFWDGPAETGHIRPTWGGYGPERRALPDQRGGLWERAMLYNALFEFHALTGAPGIAARLRADWRWVRGAFSEAELTECGSHSHANWASDDTGWDCQMFLQAHAITGDATAQRVAGGALRNAIDRWGDDALGGGLWYSDARKAKSLYQVTIALGALRLFELTGERGWLDEAASLEQWMRTHLQRPDALYWTDLGVSGPLGGNRPDDIHAAGSVSYLGGNMAIGVLQVRLAKHLGKPELRDSAVRTAREIARRMVDADGVLIDDRDAWNDGDFAVPWAREVVPEAGVGAEALRETAVSVAGRDRTPEGFYGADWGGVPAGTESRWIKAGSRPEQIMTSASAATMIIAAAALP